MATCINAFPDLGGVSRRCAPRSAPYIYVVSRHMCAKDLRQQLLPIVLRSVSVCSYVGAQPCPCLCRFPCIRLCPAPCSLSLFPSPSLLGVWTHAAKMQAT